MSSENTYVQQIQYNNQDLNLELLRSLTLTRSVNALAPFVVIRFLNPHNTLLEDVKLREMEELSIRLMDSTSDDDAEIIKAIICDIKQDVNNANILVLECMERSAYYLSQKDTRIFFKESVPTILKALSPGLKIECGDFPAHQTYNLSNRRRFGLIAQMAREMGAIVFIQSGTLVFKTKEELLKTKHIADYEYQNPGAVYQIRQPKLLNRNYTQTEEKRSYIGWHIEKGLVKSTQNKEYPTKMVNCDEVGKLDNLSKSLTPTVSFITLGEGKLKVGSSLKLTWHTGIAERPLDESYPNRVLIGDLVMHTENKFTCTVGGYI